MQYKFNRWWLITSLVVICFSCKTESQVKWENDMEIKTYNGGGMFPESKTVIIKNGSGHYTHWFESKTDTVSFTMTQQEMDELVKQINAAHFKNMTSGDKGSITYDKPTTSITLKWGKQIHEVSVSATEAIKKGNPEDFNALYNYIITLAENKSGKIN